MSVRLDTRDQALSEPLFDETRRAVRRIGPRASYWRTFWFPLQAEPRCLPEKAARELVRFVPERSRIVGVEWWIGRMRTDQVPLDFHHDRDLALFEATGRISHPRWSSVLYLNRVKGGSLFVTDQRLRRRGDEYRLVPEAPGDFALAHPEANRFVRFPGQLLHGVLDQNDRPPSRASQKGRGALRLSLVVNWWTRRPRSIPRWSAEIAYPELSID